METKKFRFLFILIWALLFIPIVQQLSGMVKVKPLSGAITEVENPVFSISNWFEGSFQSIKEAYLNEKFGFRNYFIRLNNQADYSLFNRTNANGVIIGKEDYLFEESYINAYYGLDFVGKDSIDQMLNKLQCITAALKKKNIDLILVFNPGKASYYPEYIPDKLTSKKLLTNYQYYAQKAQGMQLNVLDFKSFFINQKSTSPYPLFSKCGIHWTTYCETLAEDSLMKYIGKLRKIQVPELVIDSVKIEKGTKYRDSDIKNGLNLALGPDCGNLAYPYYHIIEKDRVKVNCTTIGDSFYWGIYGKAEISKLFNNYQFWYYFQELYNRDWMEFKKLEEIDVKTEIEKQQVIIIMATEATLPRLGWGFIDQAYAIYKNEN